MSKLILFLTFSGLSGGIYSILIMFFIAYLDGGVVELYRAHYSLYYLVGSLTVSALLIPAGLITDKIGRKRALTLGVSLLAIGGFVAPLSTEWWQLLFGSAIMSSGSAMIGPAQASLVADISLGYRREKSYGVVAFTSLAFTTVGTLVFMVYSSLFSYVLASDTYYRLMLTVSATLAVVAAIPIFFIRKSPLFDKNRVIALNNKSYEHSTIEMEGPPQSPQTPNDADLSLEQLYEVPKSIRKNNVVIKILVYNVLVGFGAGFIIPLFTYYWRDIFRLSEDAIAAITVLGDIGMAFGSVITPWVARHATRYGGRVGTIVAFQSASILFAAYLAVVPFQMNLPLAVVAYIARMDLMNMIGPLTSALLMDHSPVNRRGLVNSLANISFSVPNGISPSFTSAILAAVPAPYGYTYSISALVFLYSIGSAIYFTTRKSDKLIRLAQHV